MKNFFNYIKQVFLALIILIGIFIVESISFAILSGIFVSFISIDTLEIAAIVGMRSPYFWLIILFLLVVIMFFPVLFSIYIFKDSKRISVERGIKIHPYLWAISVLLLPVAVFIFPIYLIKRNIIWARKVSNEIHNN